MLCSSSSPHVTRGVPSAFSLLGADAQDALVRTVQQRLGPRCDEVLLRWALGAANNNVTAAVNLYLRKCCSGGEAVSDAGARQQQVTSVLRKLFRFEGGDDDGHGEDGEEDEETENGSGRGRKCGNRGLGDEHQKDGACLATLPDALIGHIASYSNVFAIGNMCVASRAISYTLCAASSFWREYFKEQYPHSGKFRKVPLLDPDACGNASSRRGDGEGESDDSEGNMEERMQDQAIVPVSYTEEKVVVVSARQRYENNNNNGGGASHTSLEPLNMCGYRRRVLRSKICEHFGCCPRCSEDALVADTMAEFYERIMQMAGQQPALVPVVFGFPSPVLVALAKENILHLGEDHIIPGDSPVWCCKKCQARFTLWPFLHPLIVEK